MEKQIVGIRNYTSNELRESAERLMHLERAFIARDGLSSENNRTVPESLVSAPYGGPAKDVNIEPYLEGMVKEYNRPMSWDANTGQPYKCSQISWS